MNYNNISIPTYVINLPERLDRRESIDREFKGRNEFDLQIRQAVKHPIGAVGLWKSIRNIVNEAYRHDDDVIIICEDDHVFTEYYERDKFISQIILAARMGTQILYGGIHGFGNALLIADGMFWFDWNIGTQFLVVFRSVFQLILSLRFTQKDAADLFLSTHVSNKLLLYPFISTQKEFGYSDVTEINEIKGIMTHRTEEAEKRLANYIRVTKKYKLGF